MNKKEIKKECMAIVNQLFDLAEVPVKKRQAINDKADKYVLNQVLRLCDVGCTLVCDDCKGTGLDNNTHFKQGCDKCEGTGVEN